MAVMQEVQLSSLHCYRCNHDWIPRKSPVTACPKCRSRLFKSPRRPSAAGIERIYRRLAKLPPVSWERLDTSTASYDKQRRAAKDELLRRGGFRTSVTDESA